jgi:anti-sigma regulatory factor (Ser/Thr protein kinase)
MAVNYDRVGHFLSRLEELKPVRAFLEAFCAESALPRPQCLRLNLVLEELFTNTVKHGHGGDCDSPVWIGLTRTNRGVQVLYEDRAPPFNPYARLPEGPPDVTLGMRKIGGLGVLLTRELAASRDYAYLYGRNRVRLTLEQA